MNNEKLTEIKNNLARLPGLEGRLKKLHNRISEAEEEVKALLRSFQKESLDVERLEKESLSSTILRLIGKYEDKLDKETQEMIEAKLAYDKAAQRVKELHAERDELSNRITSLRRDQQLYEQELDRRENEIRRNMTSEKSVLYRQLESNREAFYTQLVETDEAITAANRAKATAKRIVEHLDSAESWATYDVWFKGGLLTHAAKYGHIDNAEAEYNRLSSNMRDLRRELKDVNITNIPGMSGIDSTTRAMDFWFDNIFTDLNVRTRIREDKDQAARLVGTIDSIIRRLENNRLSIERQLTAIEQEKINLIISD